ncbi:unnamed protein product [Cylicocyclus nassatus]|uniref:Uncharacterized protein n=1 Tax=Cylicocyclus nassatus TaxID=53992 RepID=A0AA36M9R6_CYLNA|nr:unnamed protein product [Cylicocyclus nassatus]
MTRTCPASVIAGVACIHRHAVATFSAEAVLDPPSPCAFEDAEEIIPAADSYTSDYYFDPHHTTSSTFENCPSVDVQDRAKEEFNQFDTNNDPECIRVMWQSIEKTMEEIRLGSSKAALVTRKSMQKDGKKPAPTPIQAFKTVCLKELFAGCPKEYIHIMFYIDSLKYHDKPNYAVIRGLLRDALDSNALSEYPYDWEPAAAASKAKTPDKPPAEQNAKPQ